MCNIASSFILVASFAILEFYKSAYFSGFFYLNKRAGASLAIMKRTFCFWIVGKLVGQSVCLFLIVSSTVENQDLSAFMKGKTLMGFMLYFIYSFELLLTEIMPGQLVLQRSYLGIFEGVARSQSTSDLLEQTGLMPESMRQADSDGLSNSISLLNGTVDIHNQEKKQVHTTLERPAVLHS